MSMRVKRSTEKHVLVVDDHAAARESVADVLRHAGYRVNGCSSAVEGLHLLQTERFEVVITDLQMPGMDGLEFIRQISSHRLRVQVIMVTAHATISSAVEAMRHGAFDYLEKPFNITQLEQLVGRAFQRAQLLAPDESTTHEPGWEEDDTLGMVGNSPAMRDLRGLIAQVAPTEETVLICGESGTGKELVARAVHRLSKRRDGPLVSLNCPALSPQLTESELFGHRRGAFTGADEDRAGRFEMAEGGTILLDEITEIELSLQAKLLRVLQERTFERVGCSKTRPADVRVIASTNRDLLAEVSSGRFRQDLYYRLAVVPLELPPLRERGDDVLLLADYFLNRAAARLGRQVCALQEDTKKLLKEYHWPGNVRELENIITRACVLNEGHSIASAELRPWLQQPEMKNEGNEASALPVGKTLDDLEREMIVATLEHFSGHRAKTAEALGIGVRTLSGKLRSYGYAPRERPLSKAESESRQILPVQSATIAESQARRSA